MLGKIEGVVSLFKHTTPLTCKFRDSSRRDRMGQFGDSSRRGRTDSDPILITTVICIELKVVLSKGVGVDVVLQLTNDGIGPFPVYASSSIR